MPSKFVILFTCLLVASLGDSKNTGYNLVLYPGTFIKHNFLTFKFGILYTNLRARSDAGKPKSGQKPKSSSGSSAQQLLSKTQSLSTLRLGKRVRVATSASTQDEKVVMDSLASYLQTDKNSDLARKLDRRLGDSKKYYNKRVADYSLETQIPASCANKVTVSIHLKYMDSRRQELAKDKSRAYGVRVVLNKETAVMSLLYRNQPDKTRIIQMMVDKLSDRLRVYEDNRRNFERFSKVVPIKPGEQVSVKNQFQQKQAMHNELMELFRKRAQQAADQPLGAEVKTEGDIERTHVVSPSAIVDEIQKQKIRVGRKNPTC